MPAARHPRDARLLLPQDFDAVFKSGRRLRGRFFVCVAAESGRATARLGLAVARKHVPLAVSRNRIKRVAREAFRLMRTQLPVFDLVISPQRDILNGTAADWRQDLDQLLGRLRPISPSSTSDLSPP